MVKKLNSMRGTVLLAVAAALLLLLAPLVRRDAATSAQEDIKQASIAYDELEGRMDAVLQQVLALENDSSLLRFMLQKDLRQQGLYLFLYNQGVAWWWSGNEPDFLSLAPDSVRSGDLVSLNNGTYVFFKKEKNKRQALGLLLVSNNYAYQNQYLVNELNPALLLPEGTVLAEKGDAGSFAIPESGSEVFRVRLPGTSNSGSTAAALLQALALLLLLAALFRVQEFLYRQRPVASWLFIFVLLGLRWLMITMHWPSSLYETVFFSPQLYASSFWFNSPGDLLLNVLLAFLLANGFARNARDGHAKYALLYLLLYAGAAVLLNSLVSGLVLNSRISFDVSNLFELNPFTAAGLFIIVVAVFALFLLARGIVFRLQQWGFGWQKTLLYFLPALAAAALVVWILKSKAGITLYFSWVDCIFVTALLFLQFAPGKGRRFSLNFFLLNILLFSMYAAATLLLFNQKKELESRRVLVSKLQTNQDTIAEYLFDDVQRGISADRELKRMFSDPATGQDALSRRISRLYLSGYWSRYETTVTGIRKNGLPYDTLTGWSFDSTLQYIKDHGEATTNNYLYAVSKESGRLSYVSMVPILDNDSLRGHILIRLDEKLMQLAEGFPELYISSKARFRYECRKYHPVFRGFIPHPGVVGVLQQTRRRRDRTGGEIRYPNPRL